MPTPTLQSIRDLLLTSDKAVCRAVVAIYRRQTQEEKSMEGTLARNGVGFNSADAYPLTRLAKQLLHSGPEAVPAFQILGARERILKYAGQLLEIAQEREAEKLLNQLTSTETETQKETTV